MQLPSLLLNQNDKLHLLKTELRHLVKYREGSIKINGFVSLVNLENFFKNSVNQLGKRDKDFELFDKDLYVVYDKNGKILLKNKNLNFILNPNMLFNNCKKKLQSCAVQGIFKYDKLGEKYLIFYKRDLQSGKIYTIIKIENYFWDIISVNLFAIIFFGILLIIGYFLSLFFNFERAKTRPFISPIPPIRIKILFLFAFK